MENSPISNAVPTNNRFNIRRIVNEFGLSDLQRVLYSVRQNLSGNQNELRLRIFNFLTDDTSLSKVMRRKIIELHLFNQTRLQYSPQPHIAQQKNVLCQISLIDESCPQPPSTESCDIEIEELKTNYLSTDPENYLANSCDSTSKERTTKTVLRLQRVGTGVKDHLPFNLKVTLNNYVCELPTLNMSKIRGDFPWRVSVPIDITEHVNFNNFSQNKLHITWSNDPFTYIAGVSVIKILTCEDLLVKLKNRPVYSIDKTKELIKNLMNNEAELNVDSLIITLKDPITTLSMKLPFRGLKCVHLQCFDPISFLQMNKLKGTWECPICKKQMKFKNIVIDEYFLKIIQSSELSEECENIVLFKNGSWTEKKIKEINYIE
ncbi:E3 SUMO-protein ligase PIAS1-like [Melanaphis sacchari]|uniref:E3 SUMO-protein ligase PIAS1-like n=1 Tax=Melanaphis sacchari TaxID=742174 RepID=UPI000DC1458F|nr:E3 SUMO-protein ligase PIAS1-like [Melanaphis sacchari]